MADYVDLLDGIVHEASQAHETGFDLTVAGVREVTDPGRVDFGGGELQLAGTGSLPTTKRNPDDDYEWWDLDAGQYLLEYNESLAAAATLTVQTRDALLDRGAFHPTVTIDSLDRLPLSVGGAGLKLKENARVSTVVDAETG
ncbi:dCTP deaminase [Halobacteriales archaeon Cl-PHB]